MIRLLIGALVVMAIALPAAAQMQPFPRGFERRRLRPTAPRFTSVSAAMARRWSYSWLWRDRRHVGAAGGGSCA